MTLPLELGGIQDPEVRRALENIALRFPLHAQDLANDVLLLAVTGTQRKAASGSATATWTASAVSATVNVAHGLGVTPVVAFAQTQNALNGYAVTALSSTNVSVQGFRTDNVAVSGSANFYWLAIG